MFGSGGVELRHERGGGVAPIGRLEQEAAVPVVGNDGGPAGAGDLTFEMEGRCRFFGAQRCEADQGEPECEEGSEIHRGRRVGPAYGHGWRGLVPFPSPENGNERLAKFVLHDMVPVSDKQCGPALPVRF